jgi:hypothetical protein
MQLNDALMQIAQIRRQLARSEVFRGYRAATTAFSGLVAVMAAAAQSLWLPGSVWGALILWLSAAVLSLAVVGIEMFLSCRRNASALQNELTFTAIEQFVPCLVAGALLTFVLTRFSPEELWLMPGLWGVLFGLGVFASRRLLPRGIGAVGGWYLLSGLCSIAMASQTAEFCAWHMGVIFGCGQFAAAGVFYWNLERNRG